MFNKSTDENIATLSKAVSVSAINQIVTSGTNFILGIFLIRILTINEFGIYGVLSSISYVIAGLGNAAFLSQMVVIYPEKEHTQTEAFVSSTFYLILLAGCTILSISIIGVLLSTTLFSIDFNMIHRTFSAIVFAFCWLLKEFFCRLAYTHRREIRALRINTTISISLFIAIFAMILQHISISAHIVVYCYAICALIGVCVGQLDVRLKLEPDWRQIKNNLKELWIGGKWALASDILYSGRHQAHIFITAAIAGAPGVAMINAGKLFIMPVMLLTPSFSQIYIVRLAMLRLSKPLKLLRRGITFSILNAIFVVIYGLILLFIFPYIKPIVLDDKFPLIDPFVLAWFFVALFSAARYGLEATQKALKRFKSLTIVNTVSTIFALGVVYLLLLIVGPLGAVYGFALAELFLGIILSIMVYFSVLKIQSEAN